MSDCTSGRTEVEADTAPTINAGQGQSGQSSGAGAARVQSRLVFACAPAVGATTLAAVLAARSGPPAKRQRVLTAADRPQDAADGGREVLDFASDRTSRLSFISTSEALQAGAGGDVDAASARRPVAIVPSGVEETGVGSEVEVGAADGGERARRSVCGPGIARAPEQGVDLCEGIVDGGAQNFEARSSGAVAPGFGRPHLLEIEGHISSEA